MRFKIILFFYATFFTAFANEDGCVTPNGNVGVCVDLLRCPNVLSALANPKREWQAVLNKYFCAKNGKRDKVCCQNVDHRNIHSPSQVTARNVFANDAYCGLQHSDDYAHPKTEVTIDEFPWLALILLKASDRSLTRKFPVCTGVLINTRYVLTSSDCLLPHTTNSLSVLLGKFSLENNASSDCVKNIFYSITECSDSEEFEIEERILHPYRVAYTYNNDLALLRLGKTVVFSDYIRPVCLPTADRKFANVNDKLYVSGWNDQNFIKGKTTKKKIVTTLISNELCGRILRTTVTGYNICSIGTPNNTEAQCYLDKGGPLVFSDKNQWHVEGILSEYSGRCDNSAPLIFMRVSQYLEWIYDNIRV
ncbi:hypothetical protein FQR65_LT10114 [Abscondita terminalis]|nr:hypothetical protein FQR65_LT10114 [Abscondita terminalis]